MAKRFKPGQLVKRYLKKYGKPKRISSFGTCKNMHTIYVWNKIKVIIDNVKEIAIIGEILAIKSKKKR